MQVGFDPSVLAPQAVVPVRPPVSEVARQPVRTNDQQQPQDQTQQDRRNAFQRTTFDDALDQRIVDDAARRGTSGRDASADQGTFDQQQQGSAFSGFPVQSEITFAAQVIGASDTTQTAAPADGARAYEAAARRSGAGVNSAGQDTNRSADAQSAAAHRYESASVSAGASTDATSDGPSGAATIADLARGIAQYASDTGAYSAALARPGDYLELRA